MKRLTSTNNIWLNSADPDLPVEGGIDYIIMRTYNKFGIFVDYDCEAGKNFLDEVYQNYFVQIIFNINIKFVLEFFS